jgi:rhodanese-related sulfurtransferase
MKIIFFTMAFMVSSLVINAQCAEQKKVDFTKLAQKSTTIIIDVRTPEEFSEGHIKQSINIPLQIFSDFPSAFSFGFPSQVIEDLRRFETIILVCRTGNRSGQAKELLEEKGFENAYNGGAWDEFQKNQSVIQK